MKNIKDVNILVVGDIMLDKYIVGSVERISPEAPVPILLANREYSKLGGAGNVVSNIRELGPNVIYLGIVGEDEAGLSIIQKLNKILVDNQEKILADSHIIQSKEIVTTQKTRIVAEYRLMQMIRIDKELKYVPVNTTNALCEECTKLKYESIDIIVVSDYAKGVVSEQLMTIISNMNVPIIIDPAPEHFSLYSRVRYKNTLIVTPNSKELESAQPYPNYANYIVKTLGKDGMQIYHGENLEEIYYIPQSPVEVYNVSGAGDTVTSVIAICIGMGMNLSEAAKIANECSRYVVTQPDTSTVPKAIFEKALKG